MEGRKIEFIIVWIEIGRGSKNTLFLKKIFELYNFFLNFSIKSKDPTASWPLNEHAEEGRNIKYRIVRISWGKGVKYYN